jgi:hypothetical protein
VRALIAVVAAILLLSGGMFFVGVRMDAGNLWGFDGWIAEPGCDWGNRNCEASDYRAMCAEYDGAVTDARWRTYCEGR